MRNIYTKQEATVRREHYQTEWFGTNKGCILSTYIFNLSSETFTRIAELDTIRVGGNVLAIFMANEKMEEMKLGDDVFFEILDSSIFFGSKMYSSGDCGGALVQRKSKTKERR